MERLKGIGVSGGVAVGPALVAIQRTQVIRCPIVAERVDRELTALERARARSREQLQQIRARLAQLRGSDLAAIFDAQMLILDDPLLVGRATAMVREEHVNAEWAVQCALDELAEVFNDVADPYLRERKGDVHDVAGRLRMNLRGEQGPRDLLDEVDTPCVLLADELPPSVAAQLEWDRILGFATDAGSRTYHTAILARSLGVPAVVGLHDLTARIRPGAIVRIDGDSGEVTIDPDRSAMGHVRERPPAVRLPPRPRLAGGGAAVTRDGVRIALQANIDRSEDVAAALTFGADGAGLYRSEFLLAGGPPDLIGEDEQYGEYRRVVEGMAPRAVTIRTFDVDERQLSRVRGGATIEGRWFTDTGGASHGGLRGIRFGLAHPAIFKAQLRALLRAATHGSVRILFPFVSSLQEVRAAVALLAEARAELRSRGVASGPVAVGPMIEVPAAALTARELAREADFFTIGTNDLIQYMLAVDRNDERVADLYEPLHPALLRLLRQARRAAARHRIPVSVCGEMASDPLLLPLLVGCGIDEFSMTPGALPLARTVVADIHAAEMKRVARRVLRLATSAEIERELLASMPHLGDYTTVHTHE